MLAVNEGSLLQEWKRNVSLEMALMSKEWLNDSSWVNPYTLQRTHTCCENHSSFGTKVVNPTALLHIMQAHLHWHSTSDVKFTWWYINSRYIMPTNIYSTEWNFQMNFLHYSLTACVLCAWSTEVENESNKTTECVHQKECTMVNGTTQQCMQQDVKGLLLDKESAYNKIRTGNISSIRKNTEDGFHSAVRLRRILI